MCGPSRIGDQHALWLRLRNRLDHLFTDGEWCWSEGRGVESLFNTNRFAQLVIDERTERQRGEHWFVVKFTSERSGRVRVHECCTLLVHSNDPVGEGGRGLVVIVIVGSIADICHDFRPE